MLQRDRSDVELADREAVVREGPHRLAIAGRAVDPREQLRTDLVVAVDWDAVLLQDADALAAQVIGVRMRHERAGDGPVRVEVPADQRPAIAEGLDAAIDQEARIARPDREAVARAARAIRAEGDVHASGFLARSKSFRE